MPDPNNHLNTIWISQEKDLALAEHHLYGSSRIGTLQHGTQKYKRNLGFARYELSNHLGNVLSTISDNKYHSADNGMMAITYRAHVLSQQDYMPFGLTMQGRTYQRAGSEEYRFGFNGKEDDKEWGVQDYGLRLYSPALGKFFSVDPIAGHYPELTPFQFASNSPIWCVDLDGAEGAIYWDVTPILENDFKVIHKHERQEMELHIQVLQKMNLTDAQKATLKKATDPTKHRHGVLSVEIWADEVMSLTYDDSRDRPNKDYVAWADKDINFKIPLLHKDVSFKANDVVGVLEAADAEIYRAEAVSFNASMGGHSLKFGIVTKGANRGDAGFLHEMQIAGAGTDGFDFGTLGKMLALEKGLSSNLVKPSYFKYLPSFSFAVYNRGDETYEKMKTDPMSIGKLGGLSLGGNIGPFGGGRAFEHDRAKGGYKFGDVREASFSPAPFRSLRPSINAEITGTGQIGGTFKIE